MLGGAARHVGRVASQRYTPRVLRPWLPLLGVLALQGSVALLTLHNTAFQDEALYLYAGRQILFAIGHHVPLIDPFPRYLSGDPYFYPLVAGQLDAWGGVDAARMLSMVAILATTVCVYWVSGHLYGRESAIFAAAIFAFQGSVLFLSRLATFDAPCLFLLALAVVVALRSSVARTHWDALGIGPLLVLAVLSKYAALLWLPSVLGILAWQTLMRRGWRSMLIRAGMALGSLLATAVGTLQVIDTSFLVGLQGSTTNRVIAQAAQRLDLAWEIVSLAGIGIALGIIGCLLVARAQRLTAFLFLGSGLLAPAYHLYKAEPISLDKHLAYGLYFVAPLAGYAIWRLVSYGRDAAASASWSARGWPVGVGIYLIVFALGMQQASWKYHMWGDSAGMTTVLRSLVRPAGGHYLAEDMEVARYYLQNVTDDWQWTGPFWFEYTGRQNQRLSGVSAYKAAIADGYFDAVELSFGVAAPLDITIKGELTSSKLYQLVAKVSYQDTYGSNYYWIWRKLPAPAATQAGQALAAIRPPAVTPSSVRTPGSAPPAPALSQLWSGAALWVAAPAFRLATLLPLLIPCEPLALMALLRRRRRRRAWAIDFPNAATRLPALTCCSSPRAQAPGRTLDLRERGGSLCRSVGTWHCWSRSTAWRLSGRSARWRQAFVAPVWSMPG